MRIAVKLHDSHGTSLGLFAAGICAFLAFAACNDLSPQVGQPLASSCVQSSTQQTTSGPYGPTTTSTVTACPEAGAVNTVNSGITGNVLIADQYNNRVIIVDRQGNLLWWFGDGRFAASATSVVAPNDAEVFSSAAGVKEVLIAGTGGAEPSCPAGCKDDRVLIVDYATGTPVWEYGGHENDTGLAENVRFGTDDLSSPTSARAVGNRILITDQGNHRVIEVERATGAIVWQYKGDASFNPQSAERLPSGHTLITDQGGNGGMSRILEASEDAVAGEFCESPAPSGDNPCFPNGGLGDAGLDTPSFASRLHSGTTLIADTENQRVIEVDDATGRIVWSYSVPGGAPSGAVRLENDDTLIAFGNEVIEVTHDSPPAIVYEHGGGSAGSAGNELWAPYNAKVVSDYTGLSVDAGL